MGESSSPDNLLSVPDFPEDDTHKLVHLPLNRIPIMPKRRPRVETKEPKVSNKNNEKEVTSKSSAKVLSDFIFVIIGIVFCIKWGQVIIPAIPILILLAAILTSIP